MRFDRRLITHFEWVLPLLALAVSGLGAATVYSATHVPGTPGMSPLSLRQLTWIAGGCVGMFAVLLFDYRRLERSAFEPAGIQEGSGEHTAGLPSLTNPVCPLFPHKKKHSSAERSQDL